MSETTITLALGIPDAALLAGVSTDHIRDHIRTGKLTAKKLGRRTVILRSELERWLTEAPEIAPHSAE